MTFSSANNSSQPPQHYSIQPEPENADQELDGPFLPVQESPGSATAAAPPDSGVASSGSLARQGERLPGAIVPRAQVSSRQEEFARNVSSQNYRDALASVVTQLSHLEIVTIVEDENEPVSPSGGGSQQGMPGKRMVTTIDLLDGDITNVIGSRFVENPTYSPLREMHRQQVDQGFSILDKNVQILMSAIQQLKQLAIDQG
jgi:hypothetical protein